MVISEIVEDLQTWCLRFQAAFSASLTLFVSPISLSWPIVSILFCMIFCLYVNINTNTPITGLSHYWHILTCLGLVSRFSHSRRLMPLRNYFRSKYQNLSLDPSYRPKSTIKYWKMHGSTGPRFVLASIYNMIGGIFPNSIRPRFPLNPQTYSTRVAREICD